MPAVIVVSSDEEDMEEVMPVASSSKVSKGPGAFSNGRHKSVENGYSNGGEAVGAKEAVRVALAKLDSEVSVSLFHVLQTSIVADGSLVDQLCRGAA